MGSCKHILVVEDEKHLASGIKFNLEAEGYRVTTMGDGPSALKFIEQNRDDVDLVVLDLMLPGMSGYAVCEALRAADEIMPILILSARTLAEDRTRGFDVGADQYLMKPFDLDEFLSRVKNLLAMFARRVSMLFRRVKNPGTTAPRTPVTADTVRNSRRFSFMVSKSSSDCVLGGARSPRLLERRGP